MNNDKDIVDVTTGGLQKSGFDSLGGRSLDVGLYRVRGLTESQANAIHQGQEELLAQGMKYDWTGLLKAFLRRRFKVPFAFEPTPAELMYANTLELIGYA